MGVYENVYQDGDHAAVEDVRLGTSYANTDLVGTLDLPATADVRLGTEFDNASQVGTLDIDDEANLPGVENVLNPVTYGTTLQFLGDYFVAFAGDVRLGVVYGKSNGETGVLDLPSVDDVRLGIEFDQTTKTGNVELPAEPDVRELVQYGTNSIEFTGTLVTAPGDPVYPSQSNVRDGIQYGTLDVLQFTGNVTDAAQSDVLLGVLYGAKGVEFTGSLDVGTSTDPMQQDIRVIRGDDYLVDTEPPRAITWTPPEGITWPDLSNASSILFRAVNEFGHLEATPIAIDPGTLDQYLQMELTSDDTKSTPSGVYRYDVEFTDNAGNVFTLARGDYISEITYTNP
jgi:hypothetical protein